MSRWNIDAKLAKNPLYDKTDPTTGDPLHAGMIRDGTTDKRGLAMNPDNLSMGINTSNQLYGVPPDYPPCGPVQISHNTNDMYDGSDTLHYVSGQQNGMTIDGSIATDMSGVLRVHGFNWGVIFASQTYRVAAASPPTGRYAFYLGDGRGIANALGSRNYSESDVIASGAILLAQGLLSSDLYKTPGGHGEVWFPEPLDLSVMATNSASAPYIDILWGCDVWPYDMQWCIFYEGLPT